MEAKDAIRAAKDYVKEIFADEGVLNVGLEEISFDENADAWDVTVGFSRPWDTRSSVLAVAAGLQGPAQFKRTYKIVEVSNNDGKVLAVRNRSAEYAA